MNTKGQLKKLSIILTMSGLLFAAQVSVSPTSIPIGAAVNVGGVATADHHYVQSLRITFQNNGPGAWAANEDVVINFPASIGLADVNGDLAYADEVSLISAVAAAVAPTVASATANSITINIANGAADKPANGDQLIVVFPVTTAADASGSASYSITYGSGNEESGGTSSPSVSFVSSLALAAFHANYDWDAQVSTITIGGTIEAGDKFTATINGTDKLFTAVAGALTATNIADGLSAVIGTSVAGITVDGVSNATVVLTGAVAGTAFTLAVETVEGDDAAADQQTMAAVLTTANYNASDELGYLYPAAAGAMLASALPDLVMESTANGAVREFVDGASNWDGFNYTGQGNTSTMDDIVYEVWASKTANLTQVTAANGFKLVGAHDQDDTFPATDRNEGDLIPTVQLALYEDEDNTAYTGLAAGLDFTEDTWYFYLTSSQTADWVLQGGAALVVSHHPVFTGEGADNAINATSIVGGLDFDKDNNYEGATGEHDDVANMFLDSDVLVKNLIDKAGVVPAAGADESATGQTNTVKIYMNTRDVDDASQTDVWISTTDAMGEANLTVAGSAPTETVTLANATKLNSSGLVEGQNTVFAYTMDVNTAEGDYYIYFVTNDGKNQNIYQCILANGSKKQLKISHYPYFEFSQVQGGSVAFNTAELTSFAISWANDNVHGDFDQDDNATITLYACTGAYDDVIGAAETHNSATLSSCLQIGGSISEDLDTQAGNTYDWNVRNGKSQVSTVTVGPNDGGIEVGDVFAVTVNGSSVSFTATVGTMANVASGLQPLIHALSGVAATSSAAVVTIIADVPGTAFTLSATATNVSGGADNQVITPATTTAAGVAIPADTYHIFAKIDDGGGHVLYQQLKSVQDLSDTGQNDRPVVVSHGSYFSPLTPTAGTAVSLNHTDTYVFYWDAFDQDATDANKKIAIFLAPVANLTTAFNTYAAADLANHYAVTSATGQNHEETAGHPAVLASAGKYLFDVDKMAADMAGTGAQPNGTYYVYYYFTEDGTFDADEFPFQADGTLAISNATLTDPYTATGGTANAGFELAPDSPVVGKGDLIDYTVYANDATFNAELISFGITFDNTKFSAIDMITTDDGLDNDNDGSSDEDNAEDTGTQAFQSHAGATAGWTFSAVPADASTIRLISGGTDLTYEHDQGNNGSGGGGIVEIANNIGSAALFAAALKAIIDGASGHNAGTPDSKIIVRVNGAAITLQQAGTFLGSQGNTAITLGGGMAAAITDPDPAAFVDGFGWGGQQLTNTKVTSGTTDELRFVQWKDGGLALTANAATSGIAIAKFQLQKIAHNATASMLSDTISFQTSGVAATKIIRHTNVEIPINAASKRGSFVKTASRGKLSGNIDLEGRTDAAQTVTITLSSTGSYTEISDATYNAAQGDVITLGTGGSYTLSEIPTGNYKVRVSKAGWTDQVVDNVKVFPFNTTYLHFTGSDMLSGGDVVGYTNAAGAVVPDNRIVVADASAIANTYFNLAADASAGAGYSDVDGNGTVYVDDLNYSTKNVGLSNVGEGLLYKSIEADNNEALIALNQVEADNDHVVFRVSASKIGALHAYAVEMDIDANDWALTSREDHLKVNGQAIEFDKSNGHAVTLVSALIGVGSALTPNQDLVTIVLQPLVNDPVEPVITEVTLIDDQHRSTKAVISNNGLVVPNEFILNQNFPNPFNPVTNIAFAIPQDGMVKLTVFDLMGREVRELVSSRLSGGNYTANWNSTNTFGSKVSSGLYFYSLTVDNKMIATQKMILMK